MRNSILFSILTGAALFAASPTAHAKCGNDYFPSGVGSSWTYDNKGDDKDEGSYTMVVTKNDGTNITLHAKGEMKDPQSGNTTPIDTDINGTCTSEGFKMDFSAIQQAARGAHGGPGGGTAAGPTMKTVSQDGVMFPTADKLKPGYSWTDSRTIEMSMPNMPPQAAAHMAQGQGGGMQMTSKTTHTVIGTEKITVAAGTFEALKITEDTEMSGAMGNGMKVQRTTWIAKGVGIVKGEGSMMGHTHSQELAKYSAK